jgi:AcrR family transcriptional regulator
MVRPYANVWSVSRTGSRLSRDDWASAALDALSGGGLAAVAVEPLALRLGTTKGSFYWHFRNRDDLIGAALDLWRRASTTTVIERLEASAAPPDQRLRELFLVVFAPAARTRADLALLADADHPLVGPVLAEVTRQRLGYITTLFRELRFPAARAKRRALLAYSAYLGQLQLLRSAPDLVPSTPQALSAYADDVLQALMTDRDAP